jgi:hypothetical protein
LYAAITIDRVRETLVTEFEAFLRPTEIIDWSHPVVRAKATELAAGSPSQVDTAKRCFEFVRDQIQHSSDFQRNPVTCSASKHSYTGPAIAMRKVICSPRCCAPAGFCYQRLSVHDNGAPYSLHGLNAVYLKEFGWYRIDARGNKQGVDAQFRPPVEQLAFHVVFPDKECNFPEILPDPLPVVIDTLRLHSTWDAMLANLPDWPFLSLQPPQ